MTHKSYHWKFCPMSGDKPYDLFTEKDDLLVAVKQFHETYGSISVSSVRKVAETFYYEFSEDFAEVFEQK